MRNQDKQVKAYKVKIKNHGISATGSALQDPFSHLFLI